VLTYDGELDLNAIAPDLPVVRIREFRCNEGAVSDGAEIGAIVGEPGAGLMISPAGGCTFGLAYRSSTGTPLSLSTSPRGYLLGQGARAASGVTLACASVVVHAPTAVSGVLETQGVELECFAIRPDESVASVVAVPVNGEYAAWVASVTASTGVAGRFVVEWVRDFSFQFLNISDEGRPATDGVYATEIELNGDQLTVGATSLVSSSTKPEDQPAEPWVPSDEEKARFGPHMVLPDGPDGGPALISDGVADAGSTPDGGI